MTGKKGATALAAAVIAVGLGACGSGSKSTSSKSSASESTSTPAAPAPKGAAFNLGAVCTCSGPQGSANRTLATVSRVWASSVNAAGGINGHPVKITALDDGGAPAKALANVKKLVESEHIQALVSDGSLADGAFEDYLAGKGVPVVGGISVSQPFLTNPNWFATGASLPVQTVADAQVAKAKGKNTLGVMYCAEAPICAQLIPLAKLAAQLAGLSGGVESTKVSATSPSYTAPCLQFKNKGADALFGAVLPQVVGRVLADCAQQGYKPLNVGAMPSALQTWLKDPNFEGTILVGPSPNSTDASNPGIRAFLAALNRYAPGVVGSSEFSYNAVFPWVAGKLFEAAAKAGNLAPTSTPADVKQALYKVKNETLGGLAPPLSYKRGQPAFVPCYYAVTIKGGKYVDLNGGKPSCLTSAQATTLAKALKQS